MKDPFDANDDRDAEALARWAAEVTTRDGAGEPPPSATRRRLLDTLASVDRFRPLFDVIRPIVDLDDAALRAVLARIDAPEDWVTLTPAVRHIDFTPGPCAAGSEAGLIRVSAAGWFPLHRHSGRELVCVLEGAGLLDGARYLPGAVIESAEGTRHRFQAGSERDLIVLVVHNGVTFEQKPRSVSAPGS
jgi:hypothetical protein